ncbi:transposase [Kocuria sp. JC486]|nr:transposase [Kocuria sp. JC486]
MHGGAPGTGNRELPKLASLRQTLQRRQVDALPHFDCPGTSDGSTEAIHGRHEHLRASALGFRSLTHYIARWLLETGGFRSYPCPLMR